MAQQLPSECKAAPAQETHSVSAVSYCTGSMKKEAFYVERCDHGLDSYPSRNHHDRCLPLRVGCRVTKSDCSGAVVCLGPHQHLGSACCAPGSETFYATPQREARPCPFGQHPSCLPHQPSGGHQVSRATAGGPGPVELSQPRLASLRAMYLPGCSWWPLFGWEERGSPCCADFSTANHGASQTWQTSCPS